MTGRSQLALSAQIAQFCVWGAGGATMQQPTAAITADLER
jgi:hypothetical protein